MPLVLGEKVKTPFLWAIGQHSTEKLHASYLATPHGLADLSAVADRCTRNVLSLMVASGSNHAVGDEPVK